MTTAQNMKRIAAAKALEFVQNGMRLGIGTGSTAEEFIHLLANRMSDGFHVIGVPTSQRSQTLCEKLHIPLTTLDACPELDLAIDGADEIDDALNLIKGGGGALLREKIVAQAAHEMIVIADDSKHVRQLGAFPLPIEVNPFGLQTTKRAIERALAHLNISADPCLRYNDDSIFITDGGHYIFDVALRAIPDLHALSHSLHDIAGVVEHGLFLGLASKAILAKSDGTIQLLT